MLVSVVNQSLERKTVSIYSILLRILQSQNKVKMGNFVCILTLILRNTMVTKMNEIVENKPRSLDVSNLHS